MREVCGCRARSEVYEGLKSGLIVRKGYYRRKSDCKRVQRYRCLSCLRGFSSASFGECWGQNKRQINAQVFRFLCSGVSMRRTARLLRTNPKTVARKLAFLASVERRKKAKWLEKATDRSRVSEVVFDEMESSIHTKCKPVSIALAVSPQRMILGHEVSIMPAKGRLAAVSLAKYGPRPDHRPRGLHTLLESIRPYVTDQPQFKSDQCPRYPAPLKNLYPGSLHQTFKGRRGCVVGQGELKKVAFDPLFALNHTAAMIRANVNRMFRKTWCTSKKIQSLDDHLTLYAAYHNRYLLAQSL